MRTPHLFAAAGLFAAAVGVAAVAQPPAGPDATRDEVARLKQAVATANQTTGVVARRLGPLADKIDRLQEKVKAITPPKVVPPPAEKVKVEATPPARAAGPSGSTGPKTAADKKEARLPLSGESNKKTNLGVVCEGGRIYLFDIDAIGAVADKEMGRVLGDDRKKEQLLSSLSMSLGAFPVTSGDYDIKSLTVLASPRGGGSYRVTRRYELGRKASAAGMTLEEAKSPRSALQTRLAKLKAADNIIQFSVYPDTESVDNFRAVRKIVVQLGYEYGWYPMSVGEAIKVGGGKATKQ